MELNQDPNSVYYLHPSDHTGMKLVSVVFTGTNFMIWKRSMTIGLTAKNKLSFVDGTLNKPEITAENFKAWSRCNSMVIGWIITALDPQIAASILYVDTAREVWVDLEDRFGQVTSAQIYALQQEVYQTNQENVPIAESYTQLKKVWDALDNLQPLPACECDNCTCNVTQKFLKIQQDQRLMLFLMKLSNQYANVRSHILMMETMPNLPQAYRILMQEQRHREISKGPNVMTDSVAFAVERKPYGDRQQSFRPFNVPHNSQFKGPGQNISRNNVPNGNVVDQKMFTTKQYFCEHCKVPGHSVERCFKIHGYSHGFKQNPPRRYAAYASGEESTDVNQMEGVTETSSSNLAPHITLDQYNHLLSMINKQKDQDSSYSGAGSEIGCSGLFAGTHCLLSYTSTDDWILDSGASDHMCHDLTLFDTYSEILEENIYITIPDGSKIKVTHMGTVKINDYITLRNVLFVPTFKFNLISVLKLCRDENCIVQFSSNGCTI